LHAAPTMSTTPETDTETEMTIALNIFLAAIVIVGIVGMLAGSVVAQNRDASTGTPRTARRRRRATARAQFVGRTIENRA
jgi:hypothetical protein